MKHFHFSSWLLNYDLSKISAELVMSLKQNVVFAKFREMLFDNNLTSSYTHIRWQSKNHLEVICVIFSDFLLKALSQ